MYTLEIAIECDHENDDIGTGKIIRVTRPTDCNPLIVVSHVSGCPEYFVSDFTWLNYWKPEMLGAVLLVFGIAIGCFGKKLFGLLSAMSITIFLVISIIYAFTAYFTFMKNTTAFIITLSTLAIMAILVVLCLKRLIFFAFNITALGALTGFNIGTLLYILVYKASDWESFLGAILFTSLFTTFGALVTFLNRGRRPYLTSMLGLLAACLVTRGFSLLLGGYPIDPVTWALLINDMPIIDVNALVWLYPVLIAIISLIFMCWLASYRL